jgi:polyhydroxyalkanoate synthase
MPRAKRKENLETAAAPLSPVSPPAQLEPSAPSTSAAQAEPVAQSERFDPTFGFGTIMPMAMAQMSEAMSRFPGMDWISRLQGKPPAALRIDQNRLLGLQAEYTQRTQQLLKMAATGDAPELKDRRFSDDSWRDQNQPWGWAAALYLVNSEFLRRTAELLEGDPKTVERVCFAVGQWCDALAPSNFLATNPEAQRRIVESKGESLRHGIDNLLSDLQKGRISMTDEEAFEVGRNVATSPGAVVFQNELFQLIQYGSSTDKVGSRPLLMVPPCINKYYVLDLQPENSLVGFAVSRGHTVFMVSWCNPGPELAHLTWDDYVGRGVIEAIRVACEVGGSDQINALGFCVGGTLLASALAVLEGRGEHPVASITLMSTFLDFGDPGALGLFIDETIVELREQQLGQGGLMTGRDLSTTFSFLRPNDLVWNYVVGNYLKGEEPPAFDLLYWNGDTTNLPGPMYVYYLRHMYLRNELCKPGVLEFLGQSIDLGSLSMPAYVFAAKEDHIVPWNSAYGSTQVLGGPIRFVLGASGHIAGAINPASKNKRSYWTSEVDSATAEEFPTEAAKWLRDAGEHVGSWWNDWAAWLDSHRGPLRAARKLGSADFPVIEPAPGTYVRKKAAA